MSKYAYPTTTNPVTITLYSNVPFDNTYKHHSFIYGNMGYNNGISPKGAYPHNVKQECFLDRKVLGGNYKYRRWTLTDTFNFDFKNGLIGSVTLELTYEKTNANYMKVVSGNQTWFYFITSIVQNNIDTYTLSLECDVLMTYGNDFITGIYNKPVFTTRKHSHRYTSNGLYPYCADFKTGDSSFAGVKPTIIENVEKLKYKDTNLKKIENVKWLYVCYAPSQITLVESSYLYTCKNITYPLYMICFPINVKSLTYFSTNQIGGQNITRTVDQEHLLECVKHLINNGSIHGAKISPYPPFNSATSITYNNGDLTIYGLVNESAIVGYDMRIGDNIIHFYTSTGNDNLLQLGAFSISKQVVSNYEYDPCSFRSDFINANSPTIRNNRYQDPKLLFSPFRKYKINAQYSTEGNEFFPELFFSDNLFNANTTKFIFETISTGYIGDNNFYTRLKETTGDDNSSAFNYYNYEKIGLCGSVNYQLPCGENALDVFNTTQAQSFYTSKVASGITSGLSIAGGIASIAIGAGMTGASAGTLSPMGMAMIAGGVAGIASGTAGIATDIASANAKIEDLRNTPDSINISGSNFTTDDLIAGDSNCLPYVVITECSNVIKENANDFFYNYGYEVSRECYFNTNVYFNNNNKNVVDNNLFGRTIFNYIQIKDDIVNKIDSDIPMIVKQKLSNIFNNGITLWTFFGFNFTENGYQDTFNYQIDNWLFKNNLDNTEYKGENNYE